MSLVLPNAWELSNALRLPKALVLSRIFPSTLESLYQINDQSIWFLIWIFKKNRFWKDLTKEVLEEPFMVERCYFSNGQIEYLVIRKNNRIHGIYRTWREDAQLLGESNWKDGMKHGIDRYWYWTMNRSIQILKEDYWQDGEPYNIERSWDENGNWVHQKI